MYSATIDNTSLSISNPAYSKTEGYFEAVSLTKLADGICEYYYRDGHSPVQVRWVALEQEPLCDDQLRAFNVMLANVWLALDEDCKAQEDYNRSVRA